MKKKRKRIGLFTDEERALFRAHQVELARRVQSGETELEALGSPLVGLGTRERLEYSIRRIEEELSSGYQRDS